jgi:hypothetical protein
MWIQDDDGSGTFFPGEVGMHLLVIADLDDGYGEEPVSNNLIPVSYARTASGPPPERLDDLVNNAAYTNNTGIRGVDANFNIAGVGLVSDFAGVAIPSGDPANPIANTHLTYYDVTENGGAGYPACDLSNSPIPSPGPIVLYHELSHIHDYHNGLDSTEFDAMTDENELRAQLGAEYGQRDPNNHTGCGTTPSTCCVVASISTGWPRSTQLHELRKVRDRLLRRSEVGYDFFGLLFADYYNFSPEACRLLAERPGFTGFVRERIVDPLVIALRMVDSWRAAYPSPEMAGRQFVAELDAYPTLRSLSLADLEATLDLLGEAASWGTTAAGAHPEFARELDELARRVPRSGPVKWALAAPIGLVYETLRDIAREMAASRWSVRMLMAFDRWSGELPISDAWRRWTRIELEQQLEVLAQTLLLTPSSRRVFMDRLLTSLRTCAPPPADDARPGADDPALMSIFDRYGYTRGRV